MMATIRGSRSWERKMNKLAGGVDVTRALLEGATMTEELYVQSLNDISGTRQETRYTPTRTVIVSDPYTAPNSDTGYLANSTGVTSTRKNQAEVFNSAEYAVHLEYGTDKMAPRPAMVPAFQKTIRKVSKLISEAVARSVKNA